MATGLMVKGTPTQPGFVFALKIVIIVFSVIIMGLNAWAIYLYTNPYSVYSSYSSSGSGCYYYGVYICRRGIEAVETRGLEPRYVYYGFVTAAPALAMFAAIMSLITHAAIMGVERSAGVGVFRLGVFLAYILCAIFMLSGWAYMASEAAIIVPYVSLYGSYSSYFVQLAASTAAVAAIGAITWVMIVINAILYCIACMRTEGAAVSSGLGGPSNVQMSQKNEHSVTVVSTPTPAPVYQQPYAVPQQQAYVMQPQQVAMQPQMMPQQQMMPQGYAVPQQQVMHTQ